MYSKFKWVGISFLLSCVFSNSVAIEAGQQPENEIQILIDVSGSMKQNDPKNLRIPAVKLLINLLPTGTKAGIWLFAQNSRVLVETGRVDQIWKKNALSKINKIHSLGLYTNIEEAIQTSSQDWFNASLSKKRHLILLTDGMVDVSKDIMKSAESRDRILVDQIPLLQQAGVKVLAIALSEYADAELLNKLAFDSNGWSEIAKSADQLQKLFFKIFKKAVPQESVPLQDNGFKVDPAIKEFSVLIFKQSSAPDTVLYAPDQTKIMSSKHGDNVAWLNENTYDLITIKNPQPGLWKIDAKMDTDNQVMIVTDLKFKLDEIPSHISEKESFDLTAYFSDRERIIEREDFLNLIDISIEQMDEFGGKIDSKMKPFSDKAGLFSKTMGSRLGKGKYTIKVIANGKTFQREFVQTIEVVESVIKLETDVNLSERTVRLNLYADESILDTDQMIVQAIISQANKESESRLMEKRNGTWELDVEAAEQGDSKVINFSVIANTVQGQSVSPAIKPVIIDDSLFSKAETKLSQTKAKIEKIPETGGGKQDEVEHESKEVTVAEASVNWMKTTAIVVGVNIFLIVAGFFLFKLFKKKAQEKQALLLGRLA